MLFCYCVARYGFIRVDTTEHRQAINKPINVPIINIQENSLSNNRFIISIITVHHTTQPS